MHRGRSSQLTRDRRSRRERDAVRLRPTRLLAVLGLLLVAFLYWKPTQSYVRARRQLDVRTAQVQALREQRARLQRRIAQAGTDAQLVREARRLGLVKPGEKLFIVNDIPAWRRRH